jgi:hypothetical protein
MAVQTLTLYGDSLAMALAVVVNILSLDFHPAAAAELAALLRDLHLALVPLVMLVTLELQVVPALLRLG